jgi:hypothetical protein
VGKKGRLKIENVRNEREGINIDAVDGKLKCIL